jgi:hypothetical protein
MSLAGVHFRPGGSLGRGRRWCAGPVGGALRRQPTLGGHGWGWADGWLRAALGRGAPAAGQRGYGWGWEGGWRRGLGRGRRDEPPGAGPRHGPASGRHPRGHAGHRAARHRETHPEGAGAPHGPGRGRHGGGRLLGPLRGDAPGRRVGSAGARRAAEPPAVGARLRAGAGAGGRVRHGPVGLEALQGNRPLLPRATDGRHRQRHPRGGLGGAAPWRSTAR